MAKTFDLQSKLPPLPLPTLEDTCSKYLDSVKPFLTKDEYMETEFKVELFQNGIGKDLQAKLKQLAKDSKNWVQDRWYDSYFDYRGSNPMISNISGGYESRFDFDQPCHGLLMERASNWIHSMTTIYQRVVKQEVPTQKLGRQFPMDMSQYANFFCGSRLPGERKDTLVHNIHLLPQADGSMHVVAPSKHIVVMVNARIFHVKVIDDNDVILHPKSIQRQLERIHEICKDLDQGEGVAALTMGTREKWYKAYKHLCILDRQNKTNVTLINQAIFSFAFEDDETYNLQEATEHGILGGLSKNRWFDKSCQAVIGKTGTVITTEDHVHFDGNVGCQILQDCADYLIENKFDIQPGYAPQEGEEPVEIMFTVDDTVRDYIKEAVHLHGLISSSLAFIDKPIEHYGKTFAKTVHINPDTIIQLAMQLGYFSLNKSVCPTYESGTTRMFYHGRTETARSCTVESKAWCEAMFNDSKTGRERLELFKKAVQKHDTVMLDACQGKGIDRHLLLLKKISEEEGIPLPDIFLDKAYKASGGDGNFVISSSLTGFTVLHGGMAPMLEDGYGIFYSINKERTQMVLSSWKTSQKTDHLKMYDAILSSLDKIKELCQLSKM